MSSIPVCIFNESGDEILYERGYESQLNPLCYGDIMPRIMRLAGTKETPFIVYDDGLCAYGAIKDTSSHIIVYGPVELRNLSDADIRSYARARGIPENNFRIVSRSLIELSAVLAAHYFIFYDKELPEIALWENENGPPSPKLEENEIVNYIMQNTEDDVHRMSYDSEVSYLNRIRKGEIENFDRNRADVDLTGNVNHVGRLADKSVKHFEYMVCSSITLASRAAIEGGVEPETAYNMADLYLQRLERCNDSIMAILSLHLEMQAEFARQVRNAMDNRGRISYVEKCKMFIISHLNKPFTIDELATEVNINKAYISRKFKEEMGHSIMEYTRVQRIEAAAGMLKYSDKSITTIASFLCFASQSHLGAVFKKIKGITPQQYRNERQINMRKTEFG